MGGGQASQGCPALSRTQASPLPVQRVERTAGAGVGVGMMGLHPMESTGHASPTLARLWEAPISGLTQSQSATGCPWELR